MTHLTKPRPRHLRRMGYVRELKALGQRRIRCADAWQPHLERTRGLILEAADLCEHRRAVLIVGTGLLFDIPLAELCRRFDRVVLVDIVHLWPARRLARQYQNVELVECDITAAVERVYRLARAGMPPCLDDVIADRFHDQVFDLVVSANVLSQLAVLPNAYLSRRVKAFNPERMQAFSRQLVERHLDWLSAFPNRVCLIADLERFYCQGTRTVSREESLWGVRLPRGYREWIWDLAPLPEFDFRYDVRHRVAGFVEFPRDLWLSRARSVESIDR